MPPTAAVAAPNRRLLLLDTPSLYFRAFYGVPDTRHRARRHAGQRHPRAARFRQLSRRALPARSARGLHGRRLAAGVSGRPAPVVQDPPGCTRRWRDGARRADAAGGRDRAGARRDRHLPTRRRRLRSRRRDRDAGRTRTGAGRHRHRRSRPVPARRRREAGPHRLHGARCRQSRRHRRGGGVGALRHPRPLVCRFRGVAWRPERRTARRAPVSATRPPRRSCRDSDR